MFGLDTWLTVLLIACILCACAFEFINGFHDTANAVATVIYTNSLKPSVAVVLSAVFNSIGVFTGGIAVAMGIVKLLPMEALVDQNMWHSMSMVLALLITAIVWNLGTWYFGLPASSSHTLIGSILGVGLAYSYIQGNFGAGINWAKAQDVGLSLLLSPAIGFFFAVVLMLVLKYTVKNKKIFKEHEPGKKPPIWIRSILVATSAGVSWAHGSNDGQKGVGLVMLILIGIVPGYFSLNRELDTKQLIAPTIQAQQILAKVDTFALPAADRKKVTLVLAELKDLKALAENNTAMPENISFNVRKDILLISGNVDKLIKGGHLNISEEEKKTLTVAVNGAEGSFFVAGDQKIGLRSYTDYSPAWVILMISLALGLGTMVGWKRIVITIGEKIGNSNMSYAQGASAQLVGASTIALSTYAGLPVSTTQVLTGGIAGSMVASGGVKNLQSGTLKNIAIAWLLTLPVTVVLSAALFLLFRAISS